MGRIGGRAGASFLLSGEPSILVCRHEIVVLVWCTGRILPPWKPNIPPIAAPFDSPSQPFPCMSTLSPHPRVSDDRCSGSSNIPPQPIRLPFAFSIFLASTRSPCPSRRPPQSYLPIRSSLPNRDMLPRQTRAFQRTFLASPLFALRFDRHDDRSLAIHL